MLGINLIQSNEEHDSYDLFGTINEKTIKHTMLGAYASFYFSGASLFIEALKKSTEENTTKYNKDGTGFYSNLLVPFGDWSLLLEYKNYNFLRLSPFQKDNFVNEFGYKLVDYDKLDVTFRRIA